MAETLLNVYTEVYTMLGENASATSSTFNLTTSVIPLINKIQGMICNGRVSDELTDKDITCSYLPFLYKQFFIQNVVPQKLTSPSTVWGTTLYFNCTWFATSWYLFIAGNLIRYTGKHVSNTYVTGVTGIELVYDTNAVVQQAWALPTNATFPMDLWYLNNSYKVEYIDFRNDIDLPMYFSVIQDNGGTGSKYIVIMWYRDTKDQFRLDYWNAPTAMTVDASVCALPDNRGTLVISPIVAGKLLLRDGFDMIKWQWVLSEWYNNLKNMYAKYTEQKKKFKQKVKTRAFDNYYSGVSPNQNIYYRAS
jgi:hypothetical protein